MEHAKVVRVEVVTAVALPPERVAALRTGSRRRPDGGRGRASRDPRRRLDHRRRDHADRQHGVRRQRHASAREDERRAGRERHVDGHSAGSRPAASRVSDNTTTQTSGGRIRTRQIHGHQSRRNLENHPRPDRQLRGRRRRRGSRHDRVDRRRHRARARRREHDGRRDARVPARRVRHRAEPRRRQRRRRAARRIPEDPRRRHGQAHRPHHLGAGRRRADRPGRQCARPADRRQGPDRLAEVHGDRAHRARASSIAARSRSRCRPASRRSTRWCRSAAASAS